LSDLLLTLRYKPHRCDVRSELAAESQQLTADANAAITVNPGDRIPGILADSAKLRAPNNAVIADVDSVGTVAAASSQYAHGDETTGTATAACQVIP
jgi:hypothetical protein